MSFLLSVEVINQPIMHWLSFGEVSKNDANHPKAAAPMNKVREHGICHKPSVFRVNENLIYLRFSYGSPNPMPNNVVPFGFCNSDNYSCLPHVTPLPISHE